MRQTLIKEGIQDRLSNLIGDGASTYSAQQSMMDNIKRVHYSLLGNATYGRVMSRFNLTLGGSNGLRPTVDIGYGITVGGNLITFGRAYSSNTDIDKSDGKVYQVYTNYITALRDDDHGGRTANFVNERSRVSIVQDQVGANGETQDTTSPEDLVIWEESADIVVNETKLYVGTISIIQEGSSLRVYITRASDNEGIDYQYVKDFSATQIQSSVNLRNDSLILLEKGRNRLRQLSILRLAKSTNVARTSSAESYYLNLSIIGMKNGGSEEIIRSSLELADVFSTDFDIVRYNLEDIIQEDIVALRLDSTVTTSDFTAGYGPAEVSFLIEKLT